MYRFDVRADNDQNKGPVITIEATHIFPKLIATFTREEARSALEALGLKPLDVQLLMATFADGVERMINVETNDATLQRIGFEVPR